MSGGETEFRPAPAAERKGMVKGALQEGLRHNQRMAIEAFLGIRDNVYEVLPNELAARRVGADYTECLIGVGELIGRDILRRNSEGRIHTTFAPHCVFNYGPEECFIYAITDGSATKVGITKSLSSRLRSLNTGSPNKLRVGYSHLTKRSHALRAERWVHGMLSQWRMNGEWFSLSVYDVEQQIQSAMKALHDPDERELVEMLAGTA